jgi:hypothetical protein
MTPLSKHFNIVLILLWICLFSSCKKSISAIEYEKEILKVYGTKSTEFDTVLNELLPQLNALMKNSHKRLMIVDKFNPDSSNHILLIPLIPFSNTISASSDLNNRFILINPEYVNSIAYETMLDPDAIKDILSIILLHEVCHFYLNKPGKFDDIIDTQKTDSSKASNNTLFDLTPLKMLELSVDSLAICIINKNLISKDTVCAHIARSLRRTLPILEGSILVDRILNVIGTPEENLLKDLSKTHPNFELRVAFMNYYLNPNPHKKVMLENYLKNREVRIR